MAKRKKTKQDLADERKRARVLKRAQERIGATLDSIVSDSLERLRAIPDEEWQAAVDAEDVREL